MCGQGGTEADLHNIQDCRHSSPGSSSWRGALSVPLTYRSRSLLGAHALYLHRKELCTYKRDALNYSLNRMCASFGIIPFCRIENSRVSGRRLQCLRLRHPRAVGVARQFVRPHFSPTKIKLVKSNLLDTKQGGYSSCRLIFITVAHTVAVVRWLNQF